HSDVLGVSTANEWTFYQQRKTRSSWRRNQTEQDFWGDKGRVGEQYSSLRLYTNISCVIQAARASGGLGGVGNYKPIVSTIRQFRQQLGDSNVLGALERCDRTKGLSKTHL